MTEKKPRVSIGLPVFNGERYIKTAIDSLLSQTYKDFELIISDNASTDNTRQICLEYRSKDSRIRYYRNKSNLGAVKNFNRVFELSSGEYFKWANCDDLHASEYLSRCVDALDHNPTAVLSHSKIGKINEFGELVGNYDTEIKVDSLNLHERFAGIINLSNNGWLLIHGLMRTCALRKTRLFGAYISADRTLLAELLIVGRAYQVPEMLFFRREHSQSYTNMNHTDYSKKLNWWTKDSNQKMVFPYWRICSEYFKSVGHMGLRWSERQLCYAQIGKWFLREGWLLMTADIVFNVFKPFHIPRQLMPIYNYFMQRFNPT
jgi:glycosyltransferase involved in cell wall biosynthesis